MATPLYQFVDPKGIDWRIYEVPSAQVPAPRGPQCLIFESDTAIRRVWNYPEDWQLLSSDELTALSWNR
jgi:hypothetical protein